MLHILTLRWFGVTWIQFEVGSRCEDGNMSVDIVVSACILVGIWCPARGHVLACKISVQ